MEFTFIDATGFAVAMGNPTSAPSRLPGCVPDCGASRARGRAKDGVGTGLLVVSRRPRAARRSSGRTSRLRDLCPRAAMMGIQLGLGLPVGEWVDPARRWNVAACVGRVRRGATVMVADRGTVVARLMPASEDDTTRMLWQLVTTAGIVWHGGKPLGLDPSTAPRIDPAASLARAIVEDRE